jgi:hypothetical protein
MASESAISTAQPAPVAPAGTRCTPGDAGDAPEADSRFVQFQRFEIGDVIAEWSCPVCGTSCDRRYRPGRARVYCTNACRQRAYRWRRDHRSTLGPSDHVPARARTRDRSHALRSTPDLASGRRDSTGRQITACGSFGRAAADRSQHTWHNDFVAGTPWSCRSCTKVLGVLEVPIADMIERALEHVAAKRNPR